MTQKDTLPDDLFKDLPSQEPQQDQADSCAPAQDAQSNELANLLAQLEASKLQVVQLQDQALRAKAEADNARRRAQEDIQKAHKYSLEGFAESLLPVRDTLELGLSNTTQSEQALRSGVEATLKLLSSAFEKHKLVEINPAPGTKFDPSFHNGISLLPSEHTAQTIAMVMQKGYQIADRVLRPALVAVSSGNL